jgi:hypothetical protein
VSINPFADMDRVKHVRSRSVSLQLDAESSGTDLREVNVVCTAYHIEDCMDKLLEGRLHEAVEALNACLADLEGEE